MFFTVTKDNFFLTFYHVYIFKFQQYWNNPKNCIAIHLLQNHFLNYMHERVINSVYLVGLYRRSVSVPPQHESGLQSLDPLLSGFQTEYICEKTMFLFRQWGVSVSLTSHGVITEERLDPFYNKTHFKLNRLNIHLFAH